MRWWLITLLLSMAASRLEAPPAVPPTLFETGVAIDLDTVLPANERGILCLTTDEQGRVYGGTTGRAAHLFMYDPKTDKAQRLATLPGGVGFAYSLLRLPDGALIGGTQLDPTGIAVETKADAVGKLYRFTPAAQGEAKLELLATPVPKQSIYTLAWDAETKTVVGLTWPEGHFFSYDLKTGQAQDHGPIAGHRTFETPGHAAELNRFTRDHVFYPRQIARAIAVVPGVGAITSGADGQLIHFDFATRKLSKLDVRLPAVPGREPWASLDVALARPKLAGDKCTTLVGGTSDGYLFELCVHDKQKIELYSMGRPFARGWFQGLVQLEHKQAVTPSYSLHGVVGSLDSVSRAFALHTAPRMHLRAEGIPQVDGQLSMEGFGALVADAAGNVYAGERDRIARLVRYSLKDQPKRAAKVRPAPPKLPEGPPSDLQKLEGWVVMAPGGSTTEGSGYTALAVGLDGRVYVGGSRYGGYAWLMRFDPTTGATVMEQVVNMQQLTGENLRGINSQGKIHAIIIVGPDGRIWFATKQAHEIFGTRPEYGEDEAGYPGGHLCYYDPKTGQSRSMGILKRQEGLMAGAMDPQRGKLYYRSEPRNHFLAFDVATGKVQERGHVGNNCRYMAIDKKGNVYQPGRGQYVARYNPETGYVDDLAVRVQGEGYYEAPYIVRMGPNGKLYGLGISHPWIMEFDLGSIKEGQFPEIAMRNVALAAPPGLPVQDIHAATFGKDNKLYYPLVTTGPTERAGKASQHLRIMRFDPMTGRSETVGIPDTSKLDESKVKQHYVRNEKYKLDYIQGAAVGADGTLFLMDIYPQLNVVAFPKLTAPR